MIRRIYASVLFGSTVSLVISILALFVKLLGDSLPIVVIGGLVAGVGLFIADVLTTPQP